ncbi:hypothetical protein U970_02673 [Staphylococcus aureus 56824-10]|nr:hypothetical protein U970_02673 [Staphylococcus aureus 56824-10]
MLPFIQNDSEIDNEKERFKIDVANTENEGVFFYG